jgi:hypothetical protein
LVEVHKKLGECIQRVGDTATIDAAEETKKPEVERKPIFRSAFVRTYN